MSSDRLWQIIDELVTDASPKSRESVAQRLRAAGAEAVPVLISALGHGSRFVRMTAASVLGDLRADEAVPALIETMAGDSVRVRRSAMRALISIGEAAMEPLKQACGWENPRVQRHALTALPGLVRLAHADEDSVAAAASWGLDRFPSSEAVEALEYIAANESLDNGLRSDARHAARQLRDRLRLDAEAPSEDDYQ